MQSIPFHIAYLLTQHECVIVPDLGVFAVTSPDERKAGRWGIIQPPETFLGFNTEIKHNDGLLANSVAKEKQISYKEANSLITQYVTNTLHSLGEGKNVQIKGVGSLYLKDNKIFFQPDRTLSCNAFNYGLTGVSLPYLKDLQQQEDASPIRKDKETIWIPVSRKLVNLTCSIATALLFMCIVPCPLNNVHSDKTDTQYASIIQLPAIKVINDEIIIPEIEIQTEYDSSVPQKDILILRSKVTNPVRVTRLHYYVVIASSQSQFLAKKSLASLQSKGLENAAILYTDEKYRVFTNHFENKKDAERFLIQFKSDYPEYADAWLLSSLPPNQFE